MLTINCNRSFKLSEIDRLKRVMLQGGYTKAGNEIDVVDVAEQYWLPQDILALRRHLAELPIGSDQTVMLIPPLHESVEGLLIAYDLFRRTGQLPLLPAVAVEYSTVIKIEVTGIHDPFEAFSLVRGDAHAD